MANDTQEMLENIKQLIEKASRRLELTAEKIQELYDLSSSDSRLRDEKPNETVNNSLSKKQHMANSK